MKEEGNLPGHLVVEEPQPTARNASSSSRRRALGVTLKRIFLEGERVRLQPANARWSPSRVPGRLAHHGAFGPSSGRSVTGPPPTRLRGAPRRNIPPCWAPRRPRATAVLVVTTRLVPGASRHPVLPPQVPLTSSCLALGAAVALS